MTFRSKTARAAHKAGRMNKLEMAYSQHLQEQVLAGRVDSWLFEPMKLNLAPGAACGYTPDFLVIRADGVAELHEVKGHWEDDARVKIKVAAERFPFVFKAITRDKAGWHVETFTHEATEAPTSPAAPAPDKPPQPQPKTPKRAKSSRKAALKISDLIDNTCGACDYFSNPNPETGYGVCSRCAFNPDPNLPACFFAKQ